MAVPLTSTSTHLGRPEMGSKPSTEESRARARARYHARAAKRAARVSEPLDVAALDRLRKLHSLISRLGEHFEGHLRLRVARGELTSRRPIDVDFVSNTYASRSPGAMRWLDALSEAAGALTQNAPVQPGSLRAVLSRAATALAREGLPVTPALSARYSEWICESLS